MESRAKKKKAISMKMPTKDYGIWKAMNTTQ